MSCHETNWNSDYAVAFKSTKAAKNVFLLIIVLAIVAQLSGFALVNYAGVLDPLHGPADQAATLPATQPAAEADPGATAWNTFLNWMLGGTRFIALVAGVLLALTLLLALKLALVGRLGGVAGFTSAFFWSLILLGAVTPWQQILHASVATGAMYDLGEMVAKTAKVRGAWGAEDVSLIERILFYARFVAYPIVALLIALTVQWKFCRGRKSSCLVPQQQEAAAEQSAEPNEPAE